MDQGSQLVARYKAAVSEIGFSLAVLAAAWYFYNIRMPLVIGIVICVLGGPAFPPRFAWVASLIGFGGLAALAYFYFNNEQAAAVLGIVGVLMAVWSFIDKGRKPKS